MPVAPAPSRHPHHNHQLFSDHSLNHTLPQRADWEALSDAAGPVRAQIAALLTAFAGGACPSEARRLSQ